VLTVSTLGGLDEARIAPKAQSILPSLLSFWEPDLAGALEWNKKTNASAKDKTFVQNRMLSPFSKEL
jgi:hypothetical protein